MTGALSCESWARSNPQERRTRKARTCVPAAASKGRAGMPEPLREANNGVVMLVIQYWSCRE
jgi:hypothetical protein